MIKSMTGFGRAILKNNKEEIIVELKSVNHRFLEINFKSSEAEYKVEEYVKNKISTKVKRGKVDASIKINTTNEINFSFNKKALSNIKNFIKNENLVSNELSLRDIKEIPGLLNVTRSSNRGSQNLKKTFNKALNDFLDSRIDEGKKIKNSLKDKINKINIKQKQISNLCKKDLEKKIKRYKARVNELTKNLDNQRLEQEITHLALKLDVSEEIDRIQFHLTSIKKEIDAKKSSGKKIDFILQELFRESNTLTVKLDDSKTKNLALEIKVLVEEIREQIQNIE
mgnify:FL=1